MKKDRNAFFSEYGLGGNMGGQPNMMMPAAPMHQMPGAPANMHNMSAGMHIAGEAHMAHSGSHHTPMPTDIDSRIAKLERTVNRLETRISKLEGDTHGSHHEHDAHFNNSMYMV